MASEERRAIRFLSLLLRTLALGVPPAEFGEKMSAPANRSCYSVFLSRNFLLAQTMIKAADRQMVNRRISEEY
jgi:hypothetical protein